jgi:hypothetical protein
MIKFLVAKLIAASGTHRVAHELDGLGKTPSRSRASACFITSDISRTLVNLP